MELEKGVISLTREQINGIIEETHASVKAIEKGSRLRVHMMNMVSMVNIMRAFICEFDMSTDYEEIQQKLLNTINTVEARKNRTFFLADIAVLKEAAEKYDLLLFSAEPDQVSYIAEFVRTNSGNCKYVIKHGKELKSSRN